MRSAFRRGTPQVPAIGGLQLEERSPIRRSRAFFVRTLVLGHLFEEVAAVRVVGVRHCQCPALANQLRKDVKVPHRPQKLGHLANSRFDATCSRTVCVRSSWSSSFSFASRFSTRLPVVGHAFGYSICGSRRHARLLAEGDRRIPPPIGLVIRSDSHRVRGPSDRVAPLGNAPSIRLPALQRRTGIPRCSTARRMSFRKTAARRQKTAFDFPSKRSASTRKARCPSGTDALVKFRQFAIFEMSETQSVTHGS